MTIGTKHLEEAIAKAIRRGLEEVMNNVFHRLNLLEERLQEIVERLAHCENGIAALECQRQVKHG